jgi:ABC-2 type transport system permease protein
MTSADRAITRLAMRELSRGIAAVVVGSALMLRIVVSSFDAAFSNQAVGNLESLTGNPAVRALYGRGYDLTTAGGFGVWRGGTFVLVLAALWAALATVRVLRGEEEVGRWDLLLAEPVDGPRAVGLHLAVLGAGSALLGLAIAAVFVTAGEPLGGAVLFGAGVGLTAVVGIGIGSVAAQVFGQRRRAAGAAGGVIGVFFVLRMLGDAVAALGFARWLTPFGWVSSLQAFAGNRPFPLVLLVLLAAGLLVVGRWLYGLRDLGSGLVAEPERVAPRLRLLGGVVPFAWRERLTGVAGWSVGLIVYGVIVGAITATFTDYIRDNAEFQRFASTYGIGDLSSPAGFVGLMAGVVGVLLVLQAVTSFHRGWEDESAGRLELLHALPLTRSGWLGGELLTSVAAVVVSATLSAVALWVGAVVGGADLTLGQSVAATANVASVLVLFVGIAVMLHGTAPQLALPVSAGLAVVGYFLAFLGPAAKLPEWLVALSPFDHLASVPAEPVAWTAALVMGGAGVVLGGVGFLAYSRRDLA